MNYKHAKARKLGQTGTNWRNLAQIAASVDNRRVHLTAGCHTFVLEGVSVRTAPTRN
jgi:hypothetical protein